MGSAWKPLGAVAPKKLARIHEQPYQLAQWLGRFARGYLTPADDDSHTSFVWHSENGAMATNEASFGGKKVAFAFYPRDLILSVIIDGVIGDEIAMHGRRDRDAGVWMAGVLEAHGADPVKLHDAAPYALLKTPYAQDAPYDAKTDVAGLSELARYLDNASLVLNEIVAAYGHVRPGPAPVRLWPHHFDIATIITLEDGAFETARAVGAGLAIPDKLHKEFYFYTYPWPRNERKNLPPLRSNCSYQYDGFFGAVQTMSSVLAQGDQVGAVREFFDETVTLFMDLLREEMAGRR
ncbi:MAG: hypothetical protein AAGD92_07460 [Pseudomonadota bacterium]